MTNKVETDYMGMWHYVTMKSREYRIGQFNRVLGKKSKNAARCGIVKNRYPKYKPPTNKELKKWKVDEQIDLIIEYV